MLGGGGFKQDDVALGVSKRNISVPHPRRHPDLLVRSETCDFIASQQIPDYRGGACVVTED